MPALEHWLTMESAYFVGAFVVSFVLGILGLERMKRIAIIGLLVASAAIMLFGLWSTAQKAEESADMKRKIDRLYTSVTGGDNFAFFTVEPNVATNGENHLLVTTTAPMPAFDCSMRFLSPGGDVVDSREWSFRQLPKVTARFSFATLPPGRYRADCIMGQESWQQHLEFGQTPDGVDQVFWVERGNQVVKEGP